MTHEHTDEADDGAAPYPLRVTDSSLENIGPECFGNQGGEDVGKCDDAGWYAFRQKLECGGQDDDVERVVQQAKEEEGDGQSDLGAAGRCCGSACMRSVAYK